MPINSVNALVSINSQINMSTTTLLLFLYLTTLPLFLWSHGLELKNFDNTNKNGSLYVIHVDTNVNKSYATSLCQGVGMYMPSIKTDMLALYNALGHWSVECFWLHEDGLIATLIPSKQLQYGIVLFNSTKRNIDNVVCVNKKTNNNQCTTHIAFISVLAFGIASIILTLIIACWCKTRKKEENEEERGGYMKRVRFIFG